MLRLFFPLLAILLIYAGAETLGAYLIVCFALFWLSYAGAAAHITYLEWRDKQ